jgi:hypothetical protein
LRSSTGEEINGPNVFGYNIDIPRFSTSPSRLPIRAIRYVGVDSDGSVCRFGARQSAISSIEEQSSVLVSETQKLIPNESSDKSLSLEFEAVPPKPAPLWAQVLAILLLLSALCGVIVAMYAGFPSMKKVYAEIFGVVVAGKTCRYMNFVLNIFFAYLSMAFHKLSLTSCSMHHLDYIGAFVGRHSNGFCY